MWQGWFCNQWHQIIIVASAVMYVNVQLLTAGRQCWGSTSSVPAVTGAAWALEHGAVPVEGYRATGQLGAAREESFYPVVLSVSWRNAPQACSSAAFKGKSCCCTAFGGQGKAQFPTNHREILHGIPVWNHQNACGVLLLKLIAKFLNVESSSFSGIIVNFIWLKNLIRNVKFYWTYKPKDTEG